jgi:protein TonB
MKPILTAGVLALGIHGLLFSLDFKWTARPSFENSIPLVLNMTLASATGKTTPKPSPEKEKPVLRKLTVVNRTKKQSKHTKNRHIKKASPSKTDQIPLQSKTGNTSKAITEHIPVQPKINTTSKAMAENTGETATFDFEPKEDGSRTVSKTVEQGGASLSPLETIREARPVYRSNPSPKYPRIARIRGYQGNVLLNVLVNDDGKVNDVIIFRSSGYPVLDRAAQSTVKQWLFEPGRIGEKKVDMWVRVPIRFELME